MEQLTEQKQLSPVELDIVRMISEGMTTKEIAIHTKLTENSVDVYRVRIHKKLGVGNTAECIAFCFRNGILK